MTLSCASVLPGDCFLSIQAILTNQQVQSSLVALLLILAVLFYAYMHLPGFLKGLIKRSFKSKQSKSKDTHH